MYLLCCCCFLIGLNHVYLLWSIIYLDFFIQSYLSFLFIIILVCFSFSSFLPANLVTNSSLGHFFFFSLHRFGSHTFYFSYFGESPMFNIYTTKGLCHIQGCHNLLNSLSIFGIIPWSQIPLPLCKTENSNSLPPLQLWCRPTILALLTRSTSGNMRIWGYKPCTWLPLSWCR